MLKKLLLSLLILICPLSGLAQTSVTGTVVEGPLSVRPSVCTSGDLYFATDTFVLYQCGPSNTWTTIAGGQFAYSSANSASSITLSSSGNAFFDYALVGNVTSMSVASVGQTSGTIYGVQFCQPASVGTDTVVWPAVFNNPPIVLPGVNQCTSALFKLNGSGTWDNVSPNTVSAGSQGTLQMAGPNKTFVGSGLSESSSVLTNGDDNINRGPNPNGVDIRFYGAHPVNLNSGSLVSTCSINASSSTMTVGTAANITNLDGLACVGAGAAQTMTTPAAPTVVPSGAASLSGTGVLVNSPTGSTTYSYKISMCDIGYGCTAASSAATISNGLANLGMRGPTISTITNCTSGATNTFTCLVGSTAEMSAGMTVVIKGTTDDKEFGGVKQIASVVDGTHFTYLSGVDASRGISTTTATGGTVYYALGNKIVLPTPTGAGSFYLIYGRTTGVYNLIGVSLPANLGYSDATYNVWEDYGATMSGGMVLPWWAPTTAPSSPFNDMLVTKITNISGTTVMVATPASTTVTSAGMRPDNVPAILAAYNASFTFSGGGGMIYLPVVPEVPGTLQGFITSSYLNLQGAVSQASRLGLGGTLKFAGNWNGDLTLNPIASSAGGFGVQGHNQIFVQGAYPGIWRTGGSWNGTTISSVGNGYLLMFDTSQYMYLTNNAFSAGGTTDFMGVDVYRWPFSTLGFGTWWVNNVFASGMTQGDGQTLTPFVIIKNDNEVNMHYFPMSIKGMWFGQFPVGFVADLEMGEENQGPVMPVFSFYHAGGTAGGSVKIHNTVIDTGGYSIAADLTGISGLLGFPLTLENVSQGSGAPLITGNPFSSVSVISAAQTASNLIGQNINTTILGMGNNGSGGIAVPSVTQSAIISTGNITLTNNMGVLVQNGTGTITVDTTLGDGRGWDVVCQSGSCTLTVNAGTLSGNGAIGNIVIPTNQGVHVFLKGGNAFAYGLGGGGGGGCAPGGSANAFQYNGGGVCSFGGVNSPTINGIYDVIYNVTVGASVAPTIVLPGVPINQQSGTTYTIGAANTWNDRGTAILANNVGAQTYTMVNPSTTGFGFNFFYVIRNVGTGTVIENASGFTVNGGTSLVIQPGMTVFHWSDGVNYFASRLPELGAFADCHGAGNAVQFTASTGLFSCGSSSSGVSSLTGDAALITNSGSTGVVTLTLGTATANKVWANCTGSTATPTYCSITDAMLTAVSHAALFNTANTWTGLQDFSEATWKVPTGAGFTASATSMLGYDSTAKSMHLYINNADSIAAAFTTAPAGSKCLQSSGITGLISETAGACNSSSALSSITAATGANTIASGNNGAQIWNWALTSNQVAFTFGETTAATSGTLGNQYITKIATLAGSTAVPFNVSNSLTGTQTLPALYITPTWNTTGVVDAALLVNPTNTASGTGSLLADFQLGGTSEWKVDKAGNSTQTGSGQFGAATCTTLGTAGGFCAAEGTEPTNVAGATTLTPDSTTHEIMVATNGASTATPGMLVRRQPGAISLTGQTGAITTATLCAASAGACNIAGQYRISVYTNSQAACGTAGSMTVNLTWTDETATHTTQTLPLDQDGSNTFGNSLTLQGTAHNATGTATIWTNGTVIQYATTYVACTVSGTGTYGLRISVERLQ